jgi:3alpha(or 20beta)-hydroxysteroid dehydrogenase
MRVNHTGTFLGIKAVAPVMRAQGRGSIVNVSSVRGLSGANGLGAYVSSKFAVRGLTKVAALELGRHGIRVNSIHPGAVATAGMLGAAIDDLAAVDANFATQPIPRIGRPADVASMAVFLASDASAYCTGAEFVVDGGASAGVRRPSAPGY